MSSDHLDSIETNATVGPDGRVTVDKDTREALGIDGERWYAKLSIEPMYRKDSETEDREEVAADD